MDIISKWLIKLERLGNRLPHPTLLFVWIILLLLLLSGIAGRLGWAAIHPVTKESIAAVSLLNGDGIRQIISHLTSNFMGFSPLGPVLVAMLGLGIAERSGLLDLLLKSLVMLTRGRGLSLIVVLMGVMSSLAADSGYVVLIPLAAVLFHAAGKPPLAGIAACFMGVSGGYSANLLIGPIDVVLAGISTEAAQLYQADYVIPVTANYYFMLVSTLFITALGSWITEYITIPYLQRDRSTLAPAASMVSPKQMTKPNADFQIDPKQKQALSKVGVALLISLITLLYLTVPEGAPLRNPESGELLRSPFISHIVVIIAILFAICGIIYGRTIGTLQTQSSVIEAMEETMRTMAGYLVLMFFAAQMVAIFKWSQLGLIFAISGAEWLAALELPKSILLVMLLFLVSTINLLIGSASAKWALLAPIFVPMLMILGVAPEWTQLTYRIGDSATNIITPLMPYFALVVAYMQKYQSEAGIGTLMAVMLPYSIMLLLGWGVLLVLWSVLNLPVGLS